MYNKFTYWIFYMENEQIFVNSDHIVKYGFLKKIYNTSLLLNRHKYISKDTKRWEFRTFDQFKEMFLKIANDILKKHILYLKRNKTTDLEKSYTKNGFCFTFYNDELNVSYILNSSKGKQRVKKLLSDI